MYFKTAPLKQKTHKHWLFCLTRVWQESRNVHSWSAWLPLCWDRPLPPWRNEGCPCFSLISEGPRNFCPAVKYTHESTFNARPTLDHTHTHTQTLVLDAEMWRRTVIKSFSSVSHVLPLPHWWDSSWCGVRYFHSDNRCSLLVEQYQTSCNYRKKERRRKKIIEKPENKEKFRGEYGVKMDQCNLRQGRKSETEHGQNLRKGWRAVLKETEIRMEQGIWNHYRGDSLHRVVGVLI